MNSTLHRSGWIMVEPGVWLEDAVVETYRGRVVNVERYSGQKPVKDHGPGVIMPALINAHTHLSLSALAGRIDTTRGFTQWVRDLIDIRGKILENAISQAAVEAAGIAKAWGTGFIAEVGPFAPGCDALPAAGIEGIIFNELIGLDRNLPELPVDTDGLGFSYAGHAPHTTAPELLRNIKEFTRNRNKIFSLHLAESVEEEEFLASGRGPWAELMDSRGIDFSSWGPWGERPTKRAERLGLLGPGTLAVHTLRVTKTEIAAIAQSGASICVCPRSNLVLHVALPDIEAMFECGVPPALGTDSLASVGSLNLFDEMAFTAQHYPNLRPVDILAMTTVNGATALGRPDLGTIKPGSSDKLLYASLSAHSYDEAAKKLVSHQFDRLEWL